MSNPISHLIPTWYNINKEMFESEYFKNLPQVILDKSMKERKLILPKREDVFNAFKLCSVDNLKVVILGQDPYHTPQYPIGLAFGIQEEGTFGVPPSLLNIREEVESDLGFYSPDFDYSLQSWAKQGVLLLNTALTVLQGSPGSYINEWKPFTISIIKAINKNKDNVVWILWGRKAQFFKKFIDNKTHNILEGTHPSPLGANKGGFFGEKYFSRTNEILKNNNLKTIEWQKRI